MSEKTEQPTAKRLREAREKGDVCKSQDVPAAMSVLVIAVYLSAMSDSIYETLSTMTEVPMIVMSLPFEQALPLAADVTVACFLKLVLPLIGLVMATSIVSNLAQVGVLFAFKGAMPKLENISPSKWFQKVFSIKNAVEFLKNILKVVVLSWVVWLIMSAHLKTLFTIPNGNVGHLWAVLGEAMHDLLFAAAGAFCVIAAVDYLFQRWQYNKQHMMSKDEVKREYKEMEGDPMIKGKRKQLQQEMLAQNTLGNVRKAKVLVTNPTHFAVALDYEKDKTPLPIILAKGEGLLARRMIEIAQEEGIPIMQNVPLAHALFETGTENAYIPKDLIGPVAEVLRWVQSLGADGARGR
ncbi:MAG: EscU/YscU/HrcU family type III secretion system export apparatus switch protein [Proteobacteria bacterium]|jgi:type III secretion protein U|nr:EscU/YscU/HrcU family type III secretion system export apparatus switch protein [Pseudomonadota bacterium]